MYYKVSIETIQRNCVLQHNSITWREKYLDVDREIIGSSESRMDNHHKTVSLAEFYKYFLTPSYLSEFHSIKCSFTSNAFQTSSFYPQSTFSINNLLLITTNNFNWGVGVLYGYYCSTYNLFYRLLSGQSFRIRVLMILLPF